MLPVSQSHRLLAHSGLLVEIVQIGPDSRLRTYPRTSVASERTDRAVRAMRVAPKKSKHPCKHLQRDGETEDH